MRNRSWAIRILVLLLLSTGLVVGPVSSASTQSVHTRVDVYSPSMNRWISNDVLSPAGNRRAPVFYLLTGLGGGEDGISWFNNTGVRDFFADKNTHVVMPIGGRFSMYTDWKADDPVLGANKWQTYLTKELPAAINAQFATTGVNAIGGVSMAGGPVLDLAINAPGLYRAVGSYSGCPRASDITGQAAVRSMVEVRGGGNATNMWGPPTDPQWVIHDPYVNAEKLRGTAVYVSTGTGLPGPIDNHDPVLAIPQTIAGSAIEAITWACTRAFEGRMNEVGVPGVFRYWPEGSHSWGLFEQSLRDSWPMIAGAIGS